MAKINMGVIRNQAISAIQSEFSDVSKSSISSSVKGGIRGMSEEAALKEATAAGELFVETFLDTVRSTPGVGAIQGLLTDISAGTPVPTETVNTPNSITQYFDIPISFGDGDVHRNSLQPWRYGGVDNIISLFERGYHAHASIKGIWEGHGDTPIWSLTDREPAMFGINSRIAFVGKYGDKYKMTSIDAISQNF